MTTMWQAFCPWLRALLLCALVGHATSSQAQDLAAIPALATRVTDTAKVLAPQEQAELEARLAAIEQRTGSQVAILAVPSTQPEDIASYGIRVADAWKIGRQGVDDGVIVIVAVQDRQMRIEVGRGLEGAIPDATAKRIIEESITPAFRNGNYYAGLVAGVERIAERIVAEQLNPGSGQREADRGAGGGFFSVPLLFVIFIVIMIIRGNRRSGYYASRPHRRGFGSGVATGVILDGLIRGMGRGGGGGWGGGGGGGGWSGGGGGFGGGGASGGW